MTIDYPVWNGAEWIQVPIPVSDGQGVMVPNVAAIVYSEDRRNLLLQRRDKPGEAVRGKLEIPGGRWAAGESAAAAVTREVLEETGVAIIEVLDGSRRHDFAPGPSLETTSPRLVVAGLAGAYPALLVAFECIGRGEPRPAPDETAAPAWWPVGEVKERLTEHPDDFVWQSAALLREVLG